MLNFNSQRNLNSARFSLHQSLRVEPKKYFKSADDSQTKAKPQSRNRLLISKLAILSEFSITVSQGLNLFSSDFPPLAVTVDGMFAPRRPKQRIYPTLKRLIETKGNLISRKVGREIYRVLANVI